MFLTTPHTYSALFFVNKLVLIHKIASPFIKEYPFLQIIGSFKKPIILSTGSLKNKNKVATNTQISTALKVLNNPYVTLMHCVSEYPCKNSMYNRIDNLKHRFNTHLIGLSDHTKNIKLPKGLAIYEKHFMVDEDCIDSNVSLLPEEFKEMVEYLKS
jgi:sialic acid synthase SpsE